MNLIKKKETVCRKLKLHLSESLKVKIINFKFKINPKRLWLVLKTPSKLRNIPQSVSMAICNLHATADTPEEITDIFNNYFTSVFFAPQEDKEDNGVGKLLATEPPFRDIVLQVAEVEAVLKALDPNKATDPIRSRLES